MSVVTLSVRARLRVSVALPPLRDTADRGSARATCRSTKGSARRLASRAARLATSPREAVSALGAVSDTGRSRRGYSRRGASGRPCRQGDRRWARPELWVAEPLSPVIVATRHHDFPHNRRGLNTPSVAESPESPRRLWAGRIKIGRPVFGRADCADQGRSGLHVFHCGTASRNVKHQSSGEITASPLSRGACDPSRDLADDREHACADHRKHPDQPRGRFVAGCRAARRRKRRAGGQPRTGRPRNSSGRTPSLSSSRRSLT